MTQTKRIALWGGIPEPTGGVTYHIFDLAQRLHSEGYNVTVIDFFPSTNKLRCSFPTISSTSRSMIHFLFFARRYRNHIHISSLQSVYKLIVNTLFIRIIMGKGNAILTLHAGDSLIFLNNNNFLRTIIQPFFFNTFKTVICNKNNVLQKVKRCKFKGKLVSASPFIAPSELPLIDSETLQHVPANIIITSSGAPQELYRFEELADFCSNFKIPNHTITLNIVFYLHQHTSYEIKLMDYLKKFPNINIINTLTRQDFYKLLASSTLYIRNTDNDGYGIALAEAIMFRVPSFATNVTARPLGTIIYPLGDMKLLDQMVVDCILNYNNYKSNLSTSTTLNDSFENIVKTYL